MIRHSALPKLEHCPRYESDPVSGPAAERGTRLDAAFRAGVVGAWEPCALLPEEGDRRAVEWAVETALVLAGGDALLVAEESCRVSTPGMEHVGTADGVCPTKAMSIDLKTGRQRDYSAQMAAYAYGLMEEGFAERWTTYLLYCDQRVVEKMEWSYDSARERVEGVLASVNDPGAVAIPCDYCGWCRLRDTCPERARLAGEAIAVAEQVNASVEYPAGVTAIVERLKADPDAAGRFVLAMRLVKAQVLEPVEEHLRALLEASPEASKTIRLQRVAGAQWFGAEAIVAVAPRLGIDAVVRALGGRIGAEKFRELCASAGVPVDESLARDGEGYVKLAPPKKEKKPRTYKARSKRAVKQEEMESADIQTG